MTIERRAAQPGQWTCQDEDNLALEIAEDKRLLRLGINPGGNPVAVMLQVSRLVKSLADDEK